MIMVLDNCEHLLDASAELILTLLAACPGLTLLTTSREPIGLSGEVTWRVPSLSLADEAVELFEDRARRVKPDFTAVGEDAATVTEICKRLDGMPLAIELAAARVRALSLNEILDSLHDRFRLLTGGARRAVRRQQSLGASVDWSHALLTEPERILFRRVAAFMGGFDLEAAQEVCGGGALPRHQILDQLTLLVDKSLVVAESASGRTRYRLLETVRQYAMEKLGESGEADAVRDSHRDYYTSMAAPLDSPTPGGHEALLSWAEIEIDNLRAAFAWSVEHQEFQAALQLVSSLYPLWLLRARQQEGMAWFDAAFAGMSDPEAVVAAAVRARALADNAVLCTLVAGMAGIGQAEEALAIARELDDQALLARALTACISAAAFDVEAALPYVAEAIDVARELGDQWRLSQILAWQAYAEALAGNTVAMAAAGEEAYVIADAVGDQFMSRMSRFWGVAVADFQRGKVARAVEVLGDLRAEADAVGDLTHGLMCRIALAHTLTSLGEIAEARGQANEAVEAAAGLGPFIEIWAYAPVAQAALAAGDLSAAVEASNVAWERTMAQPELAIANVTPMAELAFVRGDLTEAKKLMDHAVAAMAGWHLTKALITRAHVAVALSDLAQAERDSREALSVAAGVQAYQVVPDALEILAEIGCAAGDHREAARFAGAADSIRRLQGGTVRLAIYEPAYAAAISTLRGALGEQDFEPAWAEGAALSLEEAIAYAQRGHGERKRPSSGWESLTPTELDVVRLVSEGLGNKDIATRLFMSHRTVQTHLTHVYAKLGITSRVQLAQQAARQA